MQVDRAYVYSKTCGEFVQITWYIVAEITSDREDESTVTQSDNEKMSQYVMLPP
jgi:hypothetical protein